jgi:mono/diheme cytochrome c family protein
MKRAATACFVMLMSALTGTCCAHAGGDHQAFDEIARGRYLATVGDCAACHTVPGGKPYAGGLPIETPFGTLVGSNLTPDRETGIGAWTDDEFINAVKQGIGRGGKRLYPAMPYTYYTRLSRTDVLAIRSYLETLEPVHNRIVSNQLPFPFNIRTTMAVWNGLYFSSGAFKPDTSKPDDWNRGAYLVEGPAHCGMCHTAKNFLGGDKTGHTLEGGTLQGWFDPDLTNDLRTGLGNWSIDDLVSYLRTGHNQISGASGPMAEVIADSTSHMTDSDLKAIAVYLKDQPARDAKPQRPVSEQDAMMRAGHAIYVDNCSACHTATGAGISRLFSALKDNPAVQASDPVSLIRVVLEGTKSVATDHAPTGPAMPALGWKLSDAQVAAVVTYIRNSWGNAASAVSASDVSRVRKQIAHDAP